MYRGQHIYFRHITPDDIDLILTWENNTENWKISSTTKPYTRDQIEEFVNLNQDIFELEQLRLVICLNTTNEVVGNIDLFDFEPEHRRVGVGILIDEKFRNQGYAHQSIILIEEYAKEVLGVKNMFCNILTDNLNSIKLFEKHNFKQIGIKKGWHQYKGNWFDEFLYLKTI